MIPSTKLAADLIVKNGVIFTSDFSFPFADSMAIRDGRILRVGNYSSLQVVFVFSHFKPIFVFVFFYFSCGFFSLATGRYVFFYAWPVEP